MRIAEQRRPAHAMTVGDRVRWERSGRSYAARPARGDGVALRALRATSYVLTSLASLAFLALVALRLEQAFPQLMP